MEKAPIMSALWAALTAPLSLLVVLGTAAAAIWWNPLALIPGVLVEGYLLISYMNDRRFLAHVSQEIRDQELSQVRKDLDKLFKEVTSMRSAANFPRERVQRARELELSFWKEYQKTGSEQGEVVHAIIEQAVRGFKRFYELILRQMKISHVLETTSIYQIQREIERLKRQAATGSSEDAAAQYRKAAGFKEQELRAMEKAVEMLTLFNAHLDTLESALGTLRTRMVNTSVLGIDAFTDDLELLTNELGALDKAVEEMMVWEKHTTR